MSDTVENKPLNENAPDINNSKDGAATSEQKANNDKLKNSPFAIKLNKTVSDICSRCGVPIADIKISEPIVFSASITCSFVWSFKCRCTDKVLKTIPEDATILSIPALDAFTQTNSKELEKESKKTEAFMKKLESASFEEENELSGQIVCFNRLSAIGRSKCKSCHGTSHVKCDKCNGKGKLVCPACNGSGSSCHVCHGKGYVTCSTCQGTGKKHCTVCKGKGETIVEREIIYDASCQRQLSISLNIPGMQTPITEFSDRDRKCILKNAVFTDGGSGHSTARGFTTSFVGKAPCYAVNVFIRNIKKPFYFILCGDNLQAICKPNIIDFAFMNESQILSDTLITSADDVEEKMKCVKSLSQKAILAKTIRSIEGYECELAKKEAVNHGITIESLLYSSTDNAKAKMLRAKLQRDLLESVTNQLIDNAQGYISEDFARNFSRNLISFVPMLLKINPKTKIIWAGITLFTWLFMMFFIYLLPKYSTCFISIVFSTVICVFTSFALTKNWTYYSVVSQLRLKHRMQKVPNLTAEAVNSAKLIVGSCIICFMGALLIRYGFI